MGQQEVLALHNFFRPVTVKYLYALKYVQSIIKMLMKYWQQRLPVLASSTRLSALSHSSNCLQASEQQWLIGLADSTDLIGLWAAIIPCTFEQWLAETARKSGSAASEPVAVTTRLEAEGFYYVALTNIFKSRELHRSSFVCNVWIFCRARARYSPRYYTKIYPQYLNRAVEPS